MPVFGRGDAASVHVPGSDALGIVVAAGAGVRGLKIGQAVILDAWTGRNIRGYETHDGFNAQFAVVDEVRAIPVPEARPPIHATEVPVNAKVARAPAVCENAAVPPLQTAA